MRAIAIILVIASAAMTVSCATRIERYDDNLICYVVDADADGTMTVFVDINYPSTGMSVVTFNQTVKSLDEAHVVLQHAIDQFNALYKLKRPLPMPQLAVSRPNGNQNASP